MTAVQAGWFITAVLGLTSGVLRTNPAAADCKLGAAQITPINVVTATPTAPVGQSFVACQDGLITSLALWVDHFATQQPVILGLQPGTDILAPTYTVVAPAFPEAFRMLFTPSFPVTGGQVYSLSVTPVSGVVRLVEGSQYLGGSLLQVENGNTVARATDLQFSLTITDAPVPATPATWGALKFTYR